MHPKIAFNANLAMGPEPLTVDCGDILLRRIGPDDFADLLSMYSHPAVARYQMWEPFSARQVQDLINSQRTLEPGAPGLPFYLGIEHVADRRLIGDCSLLITSPDDRQAELGFSLHPDFQGRGYASRAVHALLGLAFGRFGMHRVSAATDVRNERSWKLMERIGMRREAHFHENSFSKGAWVSDYLYAILEDEWRSR